MDFLILSGGWEGGIKSLWLEGFDPGSGKKANQLMGRHAGSGRPGFNCRQAGRRVSVLPLDHCLFVHAVCSPLLVDVGSYQKKAKLCSACLSACLLA